MTGSKKAFAVIGAAYGDEGKGLMTDRLVWQHGSDTVVRSNGGAQAGHTVTTPDGRRHVFSHIGSGAFAGARTHLSQHFVAHPMFFLGEREKVADLGGVVDVSIDPRAIVTTPYDILINQVVEDARGSSRHGSCGMGFGETIERNLRAETRITVADLTGNRLSLVSRLERIRRDWVADRLAKLGIAEVPTRFAAFLKDDGVFRRFLADADAFMDAVNVMDDSKIPDGAVFEGAQGLLLDQDFGAFPHVTRSNTGILNMSLIAREAGIGSIDATYATRAYTTRHGAGPLAHEGEDMSYADIVDPTNVHNDWQGTIRSAPLDIDILAGAVRHDMGRSEGVSVSATLAVSCLDQVDDGMAFFSRGHKTFAAPDDACCSIAMVSGLAVGFTSFGPTREAVVCR
jgi:adenylosuccinate synthase